MKHNISAKDKNEKEKKTLSTHYELNHIPLNSYIAVLTHNVAIFGDRTLKRVNDVTVWGLNSIGLGSL